MMFHIVITFDKDSVIAHVSKSEDRQLDHLKVLGLIGPATIRTRHLATVSGIIRQIVHSCLYVVYLNFFR